MQDALSIKLWGPLFDDFVDIHILMIWGSWGHVDDDDTRLAALGQGANPNLGLLNLLGLHRGFSL